MRNLGVAVALALAGCAIDEVSTSVHAVDTVEIHTSHINYASGAPIVVSWTGAPGALHDWIGIGPAGAPPQEVLRWVYTNGAVDGTATFPGLVAGNYVARVFDDDSYTPLAATPFSVDGTIVRTNDRAYVGGVVPPGPIQVNWGLLSQAPTNWIGLAPVGSPPTTVTSWVYTAGFGLGHHFFNAPAPGSYVARAFIEDSYTLAGESLPFEVGTTLTTAAAYAVGEPVTVTWAHTTPFAGDWVSLAPAGSPATSITYWAYTGGATSGSRGFSGLSAGAYVARFYINDEYKLLIESAPFSVGGAPLPDPETGTITVEHGTYGVGENITVTWSGLPGNFKDWIALAPQGSDNTTITRWLYANGHASGTFTFAGGIAGAGSYVARAFVNDTVVRVAQSAPFTVQN
jgi:hypothetical protein